MAELSDDDILAELGVSLEPKKAHTRSPREERIIAGFEDIVRFYEANGRAPQHGESHDIFERIYAVRLDRLRELSECRELLRDLDTHGLLKSAAAAVDPEELDDDVLLSELGIDAPPEADITTLRHVASWEERRAAEEVATHRPCTDFAKFKPLFDQVGRELASKERSTRSFGRDASITAGDFFILRGQVAYVAEVGETVKAPNGQFDARLRVIYSNGTESNLLRWSLQRALYKDEAARRITEPSAGPLFADKADDEDLESGTIYVLRSKSDHPTVAAHRDLIHKIGVTGGSVEARIGGAVHDATYLLAEVEVVATYRLFNINRAKLEKLLHRVLAAARLDLTIEDRFGHPIQPREWFLVPLPVIDEIVARVRDSSIIGMVYDPSKAAIVPDAESASGQRAPA